MTDRLLTLREVDRLHAILDAADRAWRRAEARQYWRVDASGCWNWTRPLFKGYGFATDPMRQNHSIRAHRLAWISRNGPIPDGLCVLHRCDNRRCVNPEHLFLGTRGDNNRDMTAKGRQVSPRGEANPQAKLTEEDVREIRGLHRIGGLKQETIAGLFGISQHRVSDILRGVGWNHVADTPANLYRHLLGLPTVGDQEGA